jgi:cobalt/nickel transport system permease protein
MHLAAVDQMAVNGNSFLHRAQPVTKVIMTMLFLIGLVFSDNIIEAVILLAVPAVFILLSKVDSREILHLALYPVFFSIVFALLRMQESWAAGVLVLLKALGAALNMLLLITTTSYIDVFSVFSFVLPGMIVDAFVFTYRSLFLLLDKLENLLKSIRLRGGYHPLKLLFNLRNAAGALGIMVIHAFDMSERMYRIYTLRGYSGRISLTREWRPLRRTDVLLLIFSGIVIMGVVIQWSI